MSNDKFITKDSKLHDISLYELNFKRYSERTAQFFDTSQICIDKNIEEQMRVGYQGRELFEMMQNVDDAQSDRIEFILYNEKLLIRNWGDHPFSEKGMLSIMQAFNSAKRHGSPKKPIGNKGLGFRSILNWSSNIKIKSNGICCEFSKTIAKKNWEELKKKWDTNNESKIFEEKYDNPLPLLSTTHVTEDDTTRKISSESPSEASKCTTEIEIELTNSDSNIKKDIYEKLKSLTPTTLLFLKYLQKIQIEFNITLDDEVVKSQRELTLCNFNEVEDGIYTVTTSDGSTQSEWTICTQSGNFDATQAYEVATAYCKDLPKKNVIYSFFPTEVCIDLPCILHGTFILDDSRNRIPNNEKANQEVFKNLGKTLMRLAQYLSDQSNSNSSWQPFDMVNLTEKDKSSFPDLFETISNEISASKLLPTVSNIYVSENEACWCSTELAQWLKENNQYQGELSNHLQEGYKERFSEYYALIKKTQKKNNKLPNILSNIAGNLANPCENIEVYAKFIDAVVNSKLGKFLSVLPDFDFNIINDNEKAYVLSATVENIPKCLQLTFINNDLVNSLTKLWKKRDIRDVTRTINGDISPYSKIFDVSDSDITNIKAKIATWSKGNTTEEDLKEVIKWLYKSDLKREKPLSPEMEMYGQDGQKHKACSLILKIDSNNVLFDNTDERWFLKGDLCEWMRYLETIDADDVKSFFYKMIGVATSVPVNYENAGNNNDYLNKCRTQSITGNFNLPTETQNNYTFVPNEDFFKDKELNDCLGLLATDDRVVGCLKSLVLYYQFRSVKTEQAKMSFPSFRLRSFDCFKNLSCYTLFDNMGIVSIDFDAIKQKYGKDKIEIQQLLLCLGAKNYASELPIDILYELLKKEEANENIEKRYRAIRDAIQKQRGIHSDEELQLVDKSRQIEKMYARKNRGNLEYVSSGDVYYWDNDILPKSILAEYYKLEIGSRVGEDSVKKIFGIKLVKEIQISISDAKVNAPFQKELRDKLRSVLKYILAIRCKDIDKVSDEIKKIKNLPYKIHVYSSANYCIEKTVPMQEMDMVTTKENGDEYHICYSENDVEKAIHTPTFCNVIEETFAIAFKLTGRTDYISAILKNTREENEFFIRGIINTEKFKLIEKELGISIFEIKFWKFALDRDDIYEGKLQGTDEERKEYINTLLDNPSSKFDMRIPPIDENNFKQLIDILVRTGKTEVPHDFSELDFNRFYVQKLSDLHQTNKAKYKAYLLNKEKMSYDEFIKSFNAFCDNSSIIALAEEVRYKVLNDVDLKKQYLSKITKDFNWDYSSQMPEPMRFSTIYKEIDKNIGATEEDVKRFVEIFEIEALTYFNDENCQGKYKDELEKFIKNEHPKDESAASTNSEKVTLKRGTAVIISNNDDEATNKIIRNTSGNKTKRFVTSEQLNRAGKKAEQKVHEALCDPDSEYEIIAEYSSNLAGTNGDDSKHYDLTYRKKNENIVRFLEIKAKSGDSCYFSTGEFVFATKPENVDLYDIAIVEGNDITIIESPFKDDSFKPVPDTYRLNIQVKNDDIQ